MGAASIREGASNRDFRVKEQTLASLCTFILFHTGCLFLDMVFVQLAWSALINITFYLSACLKKKIRLDNDSRDSILIFVSLSVQVIASCESFSC